MKFSELQLNEHSTPAVHQLPWLDPNTEINFVENRSRMKGTGYRDYVYRIVGTDDAVIERSNCYNDYDGTFYDSLVFYAGYFAEHREFGKNCHAASKKLGLPMEVCLALGPELCEEFASEIAKIEARKGGRLGSNSKGYTKVIPYILDQGGVNELEAGIYRRKKAITSLLAGSSETLRNKVDHMGQKNSTRVAEFLITLWQKKVS